MNVNFKHSYWVGSVVTCVLHPYMLYFICAFIVWSQEGFSVGPVNDGWIIFGYFNNDLADLIKSSTRLFSRVPVYLSLSLGDGRFQFIQYIMFGFAVLRAVIVYEVIKRIIPSNEIIAISAGFIAMFHPVDNSYFWIGATGLHFSMILALSSCLFAVIYLESGKPRHILLTLTLQAMAVFTYPGFVPLVVLLPILAWCLYGYRGRGFSFVYPVLILVFPLASLFNHFFALSVESSYSNRILDTNSSFIDAYLTAAQRMITTPVNILSNLPNDQLLLAFLGLVVTITTFFFRQMSIKRKVGGPAEDINLQDNFQFMTESKYLFVAGLGMLVIAMTLYFPYSITKLRYSESRVLLGAGFFGYMFIFLLMAALIKHISALKNLNTLLFSGILLVITFVCLSSGFEHRSVWLKKYHAQASLLGEIAEVAPEVPEDTFFLIILKDVWDARELQGFYNRELAFTFAVQHLFDDLSLQGGFYGFMSEKVMLDASGVKTRLRLKGERETLHIKYERIIPITYSRNEGAKLRTIDWLVNHASAEVINTHTIKSPLITRPVETANVCRILESPYTPSYCE